MARRREAAGATLLVNAQEAARLCGLSARTWRRWGEQGIVPAPVLLGAEKRWKRAELEAWVDADCPCREEWERRKSGAA